MSEEDDSPGMAQEKAEKLFAALRDPAYTNFVLREAVVADELPAWFVNAKDARGRERPVALLLDEETMEHLTLLIEEGPDEDAEEGDEEDELSPDPDPPTRAPARRGKRFDP